MSNTSNPIRAAQAIRDVIRGSYDPTVTPTRGDIGTLFIRKDTPEVYQKQDAGLTTNWTALSGGGGGGGGGATQVIRPAGAGLTVGGLACFDPTTGEMVPADFENLGPRTEFKGVIRVRGEAPGACSINFQGQLDGVPFSDSLSAGADFATDPNPATQALNIANAINALGAPYSASVAPDNSVVVEIGPITMPDAALNIFDPNLLVDAGGRNIVPSLVSETASTIDKDGSGTAPAESCNPVIGIVDSIAGGNATVTTFGQILEIEVGVEPIRAGEPIVFFSGQLTAGNHPQQNIYYALESGGIAERIMIIRIAENFEIQNYRIYLGDYSA